jgi:hypothetical protein
MTQGERITAMEVKLNDLEKKVDAMDAKLDQLIALRYKGAGAFWLASALLGTGIIGFIAKVFGAFGK